MRRLSDGMSTASFFSPIVDVVLNMLGATLLILMVYVYMNRGSGPPILIISEETELYRFESGSAEISDEFRKAFEVEFLPQLEQYMRIYRCDVIEVVGHTDGQAVGTGQSNLDSRLVTAYFDGQLDALSPGSNVDLGMMRAVAVIQMLRGYQEQGWFENIRYFHPSSSGQMITKDRALASPTANQADRSRRRIEIRILRSTTQSIDTTTLSRAGAAAR
jgi:hypothetical protein